MKRYDVLANAGQCVCGDRDENYGKPEDSFLTIARMWNVYLGAMPEGEVLGAKDVAAMMALLKVARIATGIYKADNWIDLAGYAACGGELDGAKDDTEPKDSGEDTAGQGGDAGFQGENTIAEKIRANKHKPFRLEMRRVSTDDGEYDVPYVKEN